MNALDGMLEDATSVRRREDFALAQCRGDEWDAHQPRGIDALLALCAGLRALFGEPAVDERRMRGNDFRL